MTVPVAAEISNIERRGHVYYWRARVPARVPNAKTPQGKYARFSLSLHQSDHRRACYMARRLNTLLAELTLGPRAAMTDKEKLEAIFRAEIERMSHQLEDVVMVARRAGRTDDVREMEADIEVGWAYRLIQLYGASRKLTFNEGCPGRALLIRAGIPTSHIPIIAETFKGECVYARSRMFEDDLLSHMERAGLPDTIPNRERAKIEFYRARADALLNVGERWPMIDRQSTALTRSTLPEAERCASEPLVPANASEERESAERLNAPSNEGKPEGASIETVVPPSTNVRGVYVSSAGLMHTAATISTSLAGHTYVSTSPSLTALSAPTPVPTESNVADKNDSVVPPMAEPLQPPDAILPAELPSTASQKPVLPLSGFVDEWERMVRNHKEEWRDATAADARVLVCLFRDILEEHGVKHSGEIGQHHIAALRDHFNWVPIKYGQSARMRAMTPKQLRDFAAAEIAKDPSYKVGLSNATIRKHWGNLNNFLKHLRGRGYEIGDFNLGDLRPSKPSKRGLRARQPKPHDDQVRPLFHLPIFTGCLGPDKQDRGIPGPHVYHSALYFMPMFFVYLGARRAEIAGLDLEAVIRTPHGPAINLEPTEIRLLKTDQSERMLPVPAEMVRLGFMDYVDKLKALGHKVLFPELFSPFLENQDPGDRLYKELSPIVRKAPEFGDGIWPRLIHALRHGFADVAYQKGMDSAVIDDISGRMGESETTTRYTNLAGLPRIIRDLNATIPIVTDHLKPQPLKLLPWVEAKRPPPWAGKKMTQKQLAELREKRQ